MKILIADDELLARQAIKIALSAAVGVDVVAECSDGDDAVHRILQYLPDVIFLDIQMPSKTGFEVLRSLPVGYFPYLIIVSAHDSYALEAYEHDASDYLLKPFTQERFDKAFQKAVRQIQLREHDKDETKHKSFAERMVQLSENAVYRNRISIREGARIIVVPCEEVLFIEASGDYVSVVTYKKKYLHAGSLTALEKSLDPLVFARTHRSFIVNIKCIKELNSHYNGDYTIVMQNGASAKLSRNYREQLMQLIG